MDKVKDNTVKVVFFSLLLDLLAFTMILPLLPALLDHYKILSNKGLYSMISHHIESLRIFLNAPDKVDTVLYGGFLGSMYSFLQFISSPITGALSDTYGRKPLMLMCLTGITLSYLLWAISKNFGIFVLARFVGGITKGNISLSMAIISDVTTSDKRGKAMALVGIAFSIGFVVGPMIGAFFAWISSGNRNETWYVVPALFASFLAASNLLYVVYNLKESLPVKSRAKNVLSGLIQSVVYINPIDLFQFTSVSGLNDKERHDLKVLGRTYFIYLFIYSGLEFTLTFLTHHVFKFTSMQQGYMFLSIGLTMAILQGSWVRKVPSHKTKTVAELGLWLIIPAFIFIGLAKNTMMLYFGIFLFAVSTAMVVTCMMTLVTKIGPEYQKGTITGIFRSLGALARAGGPLIASAGFWYFGSTATYLIGAVFLLLPPLILHTMKSL
ncbi:major facilitator superfamily domain-containing protein 10 isoform X1 [Polistes fuscatus]|uniref:major facilitator superfamily domain-containing protein 10 isoform X1 n=1 Tax=Polistes fuscatus TaxID=30207 RepID=UPI001CA826BB|nr:major facilitator superfamily domain-containing protein 10 isoform X1 [Polistes fuscatus]XP_043485575.1 major facilitator superfamily domain-containing protein 10 isoform X1 [Polistes fuscatus]